VLYLVVPAAGAALTIACSNAIVVSHGQSQKYIFFGLEKKVIMFSIAKGKVVKEFDCGSEGSVRSLS